MEKNKYENKFNKTSVFIVKAFFGDNFNILKKCGFINGFVSTNAPELDTFSEERYIILLFKNAKLDIPGAISIINESMKVKVPILFSNYRFNDYFTIVVGIPIRYEKDFDNFREGKYSKFTQDFKDLFPETKDAYNSKGVKIGKEYTLYYHIFNRTDWLKDFWKKKFNLIELEESLELWEKPNENDLELKIENLIK